ncbi:MAG TPA: pseudouridine synthase [Burkholderiaceae bacterium]|nr:pseudouridine synthase [Burkholderiaceae bacterium]
MQPMLHVLYQDDWLVAIDKPPGLLVHRTGLDAGETRFAMQMLRDQLGRHVWPVHRLDKGTSGLLLFALDADTARLMGGAFESGAGLSKTYQAMVRGWPANKGCIDHPLKQLPDDTRDLLERIQPAQTHFATLERLALPIFDGTHPDLRVARVALQPLTGRRHQLRRHMKHIAHPILGDATHGKGPLNRAVAQLIGAQRLWLHAVSLSLAHPHTGQPLHLQARPGPEWDIWQAPCLPAAGQPTRHPGHAS